ncbi:hypothetical protein P9265_06650, partial [Schinkia azotoformans]|nr:hypothetical protein [Schinkia azotoformans]
MEENSGLKGGVFSHTFYLKSRVIDSLWKENQLIFRDMSEEFVILKAESERYIREIYREKLANEAA